MADLFALEEDVCAACGHPLSRYGCRAPADIGTFCHAPPPAPKSKPRRAPRPPVKFDIPPTATAQACSRCGRSIVFVRHAVTNKWMPLEADGEHRGESHFARCTHPHESGGGDERLS